MSNTIDSFIKKWGLEEKIAKFTANDLIPIVNETVGMAEKKYNMVCGTLNPDFFTDQYAGIVQEKAHDGVKFIFISGKVIKGIEKERTLYNPLLSLLDKSLSEMYLFKNLNLFYKKDKWPILHYIVIDDKLAIVEVLHAENDASRSITCFKDKKIIDALNSKIHYCIGEDVVIQADESKDYILVDRLTRRTLYSYQGDFNEERLKFAEKYPSKWIDEAVRKEIERHEKRKSNLEKIKENDINQEKISEYTKFLNQNLQNWGYLFREELEEVDISSIA